MAARFGKALARLRSRHHERLRSAARAALKRNMKNYRTVRRNTRADARWVKHADLATVFDFLA